MRTLFEAGGLAGWLTMFSAYFWLIQVRSREEVSKQINWLTGLGAVTALVGFLVFLWPSSKFPINIPETSPWLSINNQFSLLGSLLAEAALFAWLLVEWVRRLRSKVKKSETYWLQMAMVSLWMIMLGLTIFKMYRFTWPILDIKTAWMVTVETFKQRPWQGIGAGNYLRAFDQYRPESYNLSGFWTSSFGSSTMWWWQIWTELGVVGLLGWVLIWLGWWKKELGRGRDWLVPLVGLVILLTPVSVVGIWWWWWVWANRASKRPEVVKLPKWEVGGGVVNVAVALVAVLVLAGVGFGGWQWVKIGLGEYWMRKAVVAAAGNDGVSTYNHQIKAIAYNPWNMEYRQLYAQTNLAIAIGMLQQADISDDDKERAGVLVQQAVREAKAAVALDNLEARNWSNLAVIYKQLIGVVDGAADWSFQAYDQAAVLDRINPLIRLDLGGLLFAAGRYEEADRVFEEMVRLKPDLANAWYNWAHNAKRMNRLDYAVSRLTQAVALVPVDSGDYDKASKELAEWRKELDEAIKRQQEALQQQQQQQEKAPETLKTPQPLPTVGNEEKVDVPAAELAPPAVPTVVPTETPAVTPTQ